jgi:hypothetical protein
MPRQVYEAWFDAQEGDLLFVRRSDIETMRKSGLINARATLLYVIEAESHEEAMAVHHLRQGWEPYRPHGNVDECPKCGALFYPMSSGECWHCGHVTAS